MSAQSKSIIEDLLQKPFSARSFSEKRRIVKNGRPCPKLSNLKSVHKDSKREYTRNFKESQYSLYPWLAGCPNQVTLFCWPCLLFSRVYSVWTSTGVKNLNILQTLEKKHKQSLSHLHSVLKLASFNENRVDEAPTQLIMLNSHHNQQVKKNREVLKRLIDVTCFLANQELPFRGHDESASSLNRGNYVELMNLLKRYDPTLAEHFQTATVFEGTSMAIQNDLIKAVGELLSSHICKQLQQTEFVTIMLNESSDMQMKSQLSVVFRYCLKSKIYETFVGFIDVSSGQSAEDLFELVKTYLQKYNMVQKLVALTHDGAAVSGHVNALQTKVKDLCPKAVFVPRYANALNLTLYQGLNNIRECKMFFSTLNGIATFTSHSNKKTYDVKEYLTQIIPSLVATRRCFNSRLVDIVHTYRDGIVEYFEIIQNDDSIWESKDRMAASGYSTFLKSFETDFMLNVFSRLFIRSDKLFYTLLIENIDIIFCVNQINKLDSFLKRQRAEGFSEIWQCTCRLRNDQFDSYEAKYEKIFYEIVDNLIMQISERFSSFEKLKSFDLLNGNNFNEYAQKTKFPEKIMEDLIESFPNIFEYPQLKSELTVFYASDEDIRRHITAASMGSEAIATTNTKSITPHDVLIYIDNKNIAASFEQVYKLSNLICTIPVTTAAVESTFPTLKRIKAYLRNTQGQERLSFLPLLSIEKAMLAELRNSDDFYDQVIENFLFVERRVDFMYQ